MQWLESWPEWVPRLAWTLGTIAVFYALGHLTRAIVGSRLTRLAARTHWRWDDALDAITARVPFWAILTGAQVSLRYWSLVPDDHAWIAHLLAAFAVASVTFALADIASTLLSSYGPRHSHGVPVSALAQNVVRGLVITLGTLVIVRSFGFEITPYLTALGVGGLAVALAAQKTIENLFGGVAVISDRPVFVGDVCRFGDRVGTIEDIGLRSTRIRTLDRTLITVPNAEFSAMTLENFSKRDKMLFHLTLNLRRDTTPDQVRTVLAAITRIVTEHPKVQEGALPVRFIGVGAYSLDIEVFVYILTQNGDEYLQIQQDLLLGLLDAVAAAGAALALPTQASIDYSTGSVPNPDGTASG
jgi:MscS family membrane protein